MIKQVSISNYKSVASLTLELGRLNVFIGENGCGKTSILESIAFGSAAVQDKLDNEFLASRGIRVLEPKLMKSAFSSEGLGKEIKIIFKDKLDTEIGYQINNNNENHFVSRSTEIESGTKIAKTLTEKAEYITDELNKISDNINFNNLSEKIKIDSTINNELTENLTVSMKQLTDGIKLFEKSIRLQLNSIKLLADSAIYLTTFLIYAPENHFLRRFEEEGQIKPLGIRGEGLFSHLVELSKTQPEIIGKISEQLQLIDWFDNMSIPNDLMFSERRINITDKYIKDNIQYIDQRSSNEGFLYLLFYITLFLSKNTPNFFSIDNIDNSLNPKLCTKLIQSLVQLSKENEKQVILTTHNPAILDGLDLTDDEQRLFVIYRNEEGHTKAKRVMPPKEVKGVETARLSEAFVRGYLGGLPKNF